MAESLTPRRQAIFSDLLRLKKDGRIFSVFTRSGVILVCRSRDSAPVRVMDPEAVQRLAGVGAPSRTAHGRAQVSDPGVTPDPAAAELTPGRALQPGSTPRAGVGGVGTRVSAALKRALPAEGFPQDSEKKKKWFPVAPDVEAQRIADGRGLLFWIVSV